MVFWVMLLINVITFLVTELLRPKPQLEDAKPAGLGDFTVPTATEGRPVPIIWGRVKLAGPNVVWYGDLEAAPITEKVKTGLFSSDTVTTGFRYSIGLQMALCRGPVDLLVNIRNDESFAWGEDAPSADANVIPIDAGAIYFIDEENFYGGEEAGGGGGLIGGGRIFPGTETQAISPYLAPFQVPTPAYRGTCYITWEKGEIGLAPTLRAFAFEVQRIPDGLDLATLQPGDEIIDLGANPMNVIFEVLTNTEWGLAIGSGQIDLTNFRAQAATLAAEGNGWAWVWDRVTDVLEVVNLVEQQVDGILTIDPVTGQFQFTLVRFDYTPGAQPKLNETNVVKVTRFQRPAWAETQNQIKLEFTDRRKNYTTSFALAQDMGNQDIVQALNASQIRMPGVKNPTLANQLAWREIRALSTPIATMKIVTTREHYAAVPGDVLEFTWARFGITDLAVRVMSVDRGKILENEITLDVAQDVFSFNLGSYGDPIDTGWTPVVSVAQPSLRERLWEVPYQLSLDNDRHLAVICSRDGGLHISFDVFADRSGGTSFAFEGTERDFTPTALIDGAISRDKGDVNPFRQDINVDGINDATLAELQAAGSTTIDSNDPANVILIDEELFFFESVIDAGGGIFTLQNCHAGLFDTVPADHADNSVVWFVGFGVGLLQRLGDLPAAVTAIQVKILPQTVRNTLDIASAVALSTTVGQRTLNPIPPGDPMANLNRFHDEDGWTRTTGTISVTWNTRNKFNQAFVTKQEDADIDQPGISGGHVILRRVDTSAAVVDQVNIFSDQFVMTDFIPQTNPGIPDELDFRIEITNRTTGGNEGQVVSTVNFEVFGFGLDFGGDFGGEAPNNGIVLAQGDAPFIPEPIPGSGNDREWTIDFEGTVSASEDRRLLFRFFDSLAFDQFDVNFFLPGATFTTLEAMAIETESQLNTGLALRPFTITRVGTQVRIATRFGDVLLRQQNDIGISPLNLLASVSLNQAAAGASAPIQQIAYCDFFESVFDPLIGQNVDVLSPANDPAFLNTGFDQLLLRVSPLTFEAQNLVIAAGGTQVGFSRTFLASRGAVLDDYQETLPELYDRIQASSFVTANLLTVSGPTVLSTGLTFPMNRASILFTMADNISLNTQFFETHGLTIPSFPPFKLLVKEGTPGLRGSLAGLAQVVSFATFNVDGPFTGTEISVTLDGTVFTATVGAGGWDGAADDLMDQVDADGRFDVVNRSVLPVTSFRADIIRTVTNTPFEFFSDTGFGLRIEFRDISP